MGRASNQCLVIGLSIAARTCRKVAQAAPGCRALGSLSDPQGIVGSTQNVWQWQQQGRYVPRGARAPIGGVQSLCPPL